MLLIVVVSIYKSGSSASNGSSIGSLTFTDNGNNAYARIETFSDNAPGTDDYPGRIVFSTTPDGLHHQQKDFV